MWQKFYDVAKRQIEGGKLKKAESQAIKALEAAEAGKAPERILKSLYLLCDIYADTKNPLAVETARKAVAVAEEHYGADSEDMYAALDRLAASLLSEGTIEEFQYTQMKALELAEKQDNYLGQVRALDKLVGFYISTSTFEKAETIFLKLLDLIKKYDGADSNSAFEEVPTYYKILCGLGRTEEAAALKEILSNDSRVALGLNESTENTVTDHGVDESFAPVREALRTLDPRVIVEACRETIPKLDEIRNERDSKLSESDPFLQLKKKLFNEPSWYARSILASQLRMDYWNSEGVDRNPSLLTEAATVLRESLSRFENAFDDQLLLLTLIDLADHDDSCADEIDKLIEKSANRTTSLYSKALVMFRRHGATTETRAALSEAVDFNPYVAQVMVAGPEALKQTDRANAKMMKIDEAKTYGVESAEQWLDDPDLLKLFGEVMADAVPSISKLLFEESKSRLSAFGEPLMSPPQL